MDPQEFGAFVQARRKELGMNQAELAEKLHVTAKAVSRWERGVGFPDIKLLQPLAEALEITIVELMQSKRIEEDIPKETAAEMVSRTVDQIQEQGKLSLKRKLMLLFGSVVILAAELFLLWVSNAFDFTPRWVGAMIHFIGFTGGLYGIRALRHILTGEPLTRPMHPMWEKRKNRGAMGIFLLCCIALMFLLALTAGEKSVLRDVVLVVLMIPMVASMQYIYQQWQDGSDEY